jgi:hypothetical protein
VSRSNPECTTEFDSTFKKREKEEERKMKNAEEDDMKELLERQEKKIKKEDLVTEPVPSTYFHKIHLTN